MWALEARQVSRTDQLAGLNGRPRKPGSHRTLVYATDDAHTVYAAAYGWWCMDCPATRDPDTDPLPKASAERDAKRHRERAGSRFKERQTA